MVRNVINGLYVSGTIKVFANNGTMIAKNGVGVRESGSNGGSLTTRLNPFVTHVFAASAIGLKGAAACHAFAKCFAGGTVVNGHVFRIAE